MNQEEDIVNHHVERLDIMHKHIEWGMSWKDLPTTWNDASSPLKIKDFYEPMKGLIMFNDWLTVAYYISKNISPKEERAIFDVIKHLMNDIDQKYREVLADPRNLQLKQDEWETRSLDRSLDLLPLDEEDPFSHYEKGISKIISRYFPKLRDFKPSYSKG